MLLLVLGVLVWSLVHLFPCVMPNKRNRLNDSMGNKYQGLFALTIVLSIVFMVFGWRHTVPEYVYNPPAWGRHLTMLLVFIAVVLFGAASAPSRIKQWIRHPMLIGVLVWALAHLLANGDSRSVVLFGGMLIWSVLSVFFINRRDGVWEKPVQPEGWVPDIKLLVISLVIYIVLIFLHPYFSGIPLMV